MCKEKSLPLWDLLLSEASKYESIRDGKKLKRQKKSLFDGKSWCCCEASPKGNTPADSHYLILPKSPAALWWVAPVVSGLVLDHPALILATFFSLSLLLVDWHEMRDFSAVICR